MTAKLKFLQAVTNLETEGVPDKSIIWDILTDIVHGVNWSEKSFEEIRSLSSKLREEFKA